MIAVISIDYINSSNWTVNERNTVTASLTKELNAIKGGRYEFYRGDSLQLVVKNADTALNLALLLKTSVNKLTFNNENENQNPLDIRISIGLGMESLHNDLIAQSDGSAYQLSGRRLDTMKAEDRVLCITSENPYFNEEFQVSSLFFEEIIKRWSTASAEAVYYTLKGFKEIPLAKHIGIGQSAVNKRKKVAGWHSIEAWLDRFTKAVNQYFPNNE